ncbi:hypothetical protein BJ878DRAFT_521483 [Calycina marina]|uniref:Uncharacterized protein n=1 Tax=Calycina marina TaxID=1763456 RepID=A0A9P7YXP0_9HELO|nr:hypothetical protein BJ878DRAFT_521483 [Calycina marina]
MELAGCVAGTLAMGAGSGALVAIGPPGPEDEGKSELTVFHLQESGLEVVLVVVWADFAVGLLLLVLVGAYGGGVTGTAAGAPTVTHTRPPGNIRKGTTIPPYLVVVVIVLVSLEYCDRCCCHSRSIDHLHHHSLSGDDN